MFESPTYQDTARRVFEFGKYNNNSICFLEVDYFVLVGAFKSGLSDSFAASKALNVNLRAENGAEVFRNFSKAELTSCGYRLIREKITLATADEQVYKVTETYGYAPQAVFREYDAEILTFAGYTSYTPLQEKYYWSFNAMERAGNSIVVKGANKGDAFYWTFSGFFSRWGTAWRWAPPKTSAMAVVHDDFGHVSAPVVAPNSPKYIDGFPSWSTEGFLNASYTKGFWGEGGVTIHFYSRMVQPVRKLANVTLLVQYFAENPPIIPRSRLVDAGGNEIQDSRAGTPTDLYDGMWVVEDSQIERVGNLFKRSIKISEHLYLEADKSQPPKIENYFYIMLEAASLAKPIQLSSAPADATDEELKQTLADALGSLGNSLEIALFDYKIREGSSEGEVYLAGKAAYWESQQTWLDCAQQKRVAVLSDNRVVYFDVSGAAADFVSNYAQYLAAAGSGLELAQAKQYPYAMLDAGIVRAGTLVFSGGTWKDSGDVSEEETTDSADSSQEGE